MPRTDRTWPNVGEFTLTSTDPQFTVLSTLLTFAWMLTTCERPMRTSRDAFMLSWWLQGPITMFRRELPNEPVAGMEKAAVFLPKAPTYDHKNHLYFIAAHELIHAAGLVTNDEHGSDGVFMNLPNFLPGGKVNAQQGSKEMPPLFLDSKTHSALGAIW